MFGFRMPLYRVYEVDGRFGIVRVHELVDDKYRSMRLWKESLFSTRLAAEHYCAALNKGTESWHDQADAN